MTPVDQTQNVHEILVIRIRKLHCDREPASGLLIATHHLSHQIRRSNIRRTRELDPEPGTRRHRFIKNEISPFDSEIL